MRQLRIVLLLLVLVLVIVPAASAHKLGAANRVIFGVQQGQLGYVGKAAYGDAAFSLSNPTKTSIFDLTVWINNGCSQTYAPSAPLSLLRKPAHLNPARASFSGNAWGMRWHIVSLAPGQSMSLPLRLNVPFVAFPGSPIFDPSGQQIGSSAGYSAPFLCLSAMVTSETDNSSGSTISPVWGLMGGK